MRNVERVQKIETEIRIIRKVKIKNGKKVSHWIWYIFPQLLGLGKSGMSQTYAIKDREHATEYMNNEILRNHYLECCKAILDSNKSV